MPRVLIADDHALFREGLASLISSKPGYEVVGRARDGAEAVRLAEALRPDLVVMDISMPVLDGIEATRAVVAACPGIKVAMLTMRDDEPALLAALAAGASGFIVKDCEPSELFAQLERVAGGEATVSPGLAGSVLTRLARPGERGAELSERERQVLGLVAQGTCNRRIAEELEIAENTVKKHLSNLLDKLGLENRTQLALYAIEHGLAAKPPED